MSIQDEWIVLDTNIWIFGLRPISDFPACADLLENLNRLDVSNSFLARFAALRFRSGQALRESNNLDQIRETC